MKDSVIRDQHGESNTQQLSQANSLMAEPTSLHSSFECPDWYFDEKQSAYWYHDINTNAYHLYMEASEAAPLNSTASEVAFPLWYYDRGRALYWYFCKDTNAYYMYEGYDGAFPNERQELGCGSLRMQNDLDPPAFTAIQSQNNDSSHCNGDTRAHETSNQADGNGKTCCDHTSNALVADFSSISNPSGELSCPAEERVPPLASGWVEDFLIESYLSGYSDVHPNADLSTTDTSSDFECHLSQSLAVQTNISNDSTPSQVRKQSVTHSVSNGNTNSNTRAETNCVFSHVKDSSSMTLFDGDLDVTNEKDLKEGAFLLQEDENKRLKCDINVEGVKNEERLNEEQRNVETWLAQYGQVTRTDADIIPCLGAQNLWNWRTAVQKENGKQKPIICLVGRVASTISKLHPSLQHRSGVIKTSNVCEVNRDLVKVSSGELYRLREPSSKYIRSVSVFDSSDPTKDWDFPRIPSSVSEQFENKSKPSHDSLIAKPFVPNMNHHRYQHLSTKAKKPLVREDMRILAIREFAATDQRQMYRDQAKERRDLYGGYGVGQGQRLHDNESSSSETTFMDSASQAENISVTKPVAKRLLEGMGWSEGQSLGKRKDGIKEPLQGMGNIGRAGIGWTSANH